MKNEIKIKMIDYVGLLSPDEYQALSWEDQMVWLANQPWNFPGKSSLALNLWLRQRDKEAREKATGQSIRNT
jgi:hypothetical protein